MHEVLLKAMVAKPSDYMDYGGTVERWSSQDRPYPDCSQGCRHFLPLEGALGADWGVCASQAAERFGLLTFEHQSGATCFQYS